MTPSSLPHAGAGRSGIRVDAQTKGMPAGLAPLPLEAVGGQGWNLLREDLTLPVAVLRQWALAHNIAWMRGFVAERHGVIAPHGKTTMSPVLFQRQLDAGAWAMTLATPQQVHVARAHGVRRIFLANQLVGRQAIRGIIAAQAQDPGFEFFCLVDDEANVRVLADAVREAGAPRPIQVLIEIGCPGGRSGCRDHAAALALAAAVRRASPFLALRGVEGFEGILSDPDPAREARQVEAFLGRIAEAARACDARGLFAPGEVILSAGGSAFYDLVLEHLGRVALSVPVRLVTRSGCYITHDVDKYAQAFERLARRQPAADDGDGADGVDQAAPVGLLPALEVWAYVHSRPERERVVVGVGKRDLSYDDPPRPQQWFRPGGPSSQGPRPLAPGHAVKGLNDQHGILAVPPDSPLQVGDMVQFGISHPCLTFDKWRVLCVVDDDYTVVDALATYF